MISILAILTYARLDSFISTQTIDNLYLGQRKAEREADRDGQMKIYQLLTTYSTQPPSVKDTNASPQKDLIKTKKEKPEIDSAEQPPSQSGTLHLDLIPHHAKLNLKALYKESEEMIKKDFSDATGPYYEMAAYLLRVLYQDCPFFRKVQRAEYLLLDTILASTTTKRSSQRHYDFSKQLVVSAEGLANVRLEDPSLQDLLYHILKGGEYLNNEGKSMSYPSLLDFVILEPNRMKLTISAHHASTEVLAAVLGNSEAARNLIAYRESLHEQGIKIKKNGLRETKIFLDEKKLRSFLEGEGVDFKKIKPFLDLSVKKPISSELLPSVDAKGVDKERKIKVRKKIQYKPAA
jgi:hypothetical protein